MFGFLMATLQNALILMVLNDKLAYWCDYAVQTMRVLSRHNTVVVFCSEDTISWKDIFHTNSPIRFFEKKQNALLFHPFFCIPGQRFGNIKLLNYRLNAWFLHWFLQKKYKYRKKIFWFFDPLYISSIIGYFSHFTSVYDCVDYYQGVSKQLNMQDQSLLRTVTYVFANSRTLVRKFRQYRPDIRFVPLGFAKEVFQRVTPAREKSHAGHIVGFVGGITRRIDYRLLTAVAKRMPDITFQLYGSCRSDVLDTNGELDDDIHTFFSLANVCWKGFVSKQKLPSVIASFDLCIIPYAVSDVFNLYCFPMKVMEYFYMGKPVLATPIEELRRYSKFIRIGKKPEDWESLIRNILSKPWPASYRRAQRDIAIANSWERKISRLTHQIA